MGKYINGDNDINLDSNEHNDTTDLEQIQESTTNLTDQADKPEMKQQSDISEVCQSLAALQDLFEKQIARNQNQTEMFDKLYAEMKDYKESFLLEVLHKPIIHNLIQLYDIFVVLESQFDDICSGNDEDMKDVLSQYRKNLENFRFKLEEVLFRMDVSPYTESSDTLDRQLHKTHKVIPSKDPEKDRKIAEVHKIGFNWRDKVFRPEEVTIFRYTSPTQESDDSVGEPVSNDKGSNTDG
ncbi:nucleotide exchange factor GrpE [Candidatus Poribacteria bacterium]|nr:nucleotide exchange factor GrpE [Candidatus Poribacteria bacterium]